MEEYEVEYIIGDNGFKYNPYDNTILFSTKYENFDFLTEDERDIAISDTITHEFIHMVLFKMFNNTVSGLFDTVGHLLYEKPELLDKCLKHCNGAKTWAETIKQDGIQGFYNRYDISEQDIINAIEVCQHEY